MRVLVTGAGGFVGGWLTVELRAAGHEIVTPSERLDVTDAAAVLRAVTSTNPQAVAHLAAVASAPQAATDPLRTFEVAVRGTINVLEAVRAMDEPAAILVSGSSEVYGAPAADALPLRESQPLAPATPYALSKAAQEGVAVAGAASFSLKVIVTRSFSHTGPGQRTDFVVPAIAKRVLTLADGNAEDIPVGNVDVRRDFTDVRDVARAYRRLLEAAVDSQLGGGGLIVNVCSGRSISIRWIAEELCRLAGVEPRLRVDPALVRRVDQLEVRGDPSQISTLVGWQATTPMKQTLADVWAATAGSVTVPAA
jgi:GDP-4-dehydro-6-deoxy-D-mannose reductase